MESIKTLLAAAALCVAAVASGEAAAPTAKELGETYQRTRSDADRQAWYAALEREKWDFSRRVRDKEDARGVYKLNRDSQLACIVLRKTDKAGDSWDEDLGPDGKLHLEWTRRANGAIDYKYTAPTNWDVFVSAYPGAVSRWGVKVMKARVGMDDPMPEVKLPEGWRVVPDEKYSGVNVREAWLTFEKDGLKMPPPAVEVRWPGAGVRAVYGASNVVVTAEAATFTPSARKPPTSFQTSLPREGSVSCSITHHIRGMQAGPHKAVPYPENEIKAMGNFIFALRTGFRHLGFEGKGAMEGGSIILCGFDSNYPNGHTDFPAHFHIINGNKDGTQVNHFYMDPGTGRVTWNCYQDMSNVMDVWDVVHKYYPGDTIPMYDGRGRVAYRVQMLKDGTGFEIARPGDARAFRACGTRPCDAVEVWLKDADADWRKTATVTVKDDPVAGVLETPDGVVRYEPDTGARK